MVTRRDLLKMGLTARAAWLRSPRAVKFHRDLPQTPVWAYVDSAGPTSQRLFSFRYPRINMGAAEGSGILVRVHNSLTTTPGDFLDRSSSTAIASSTRTWR
jgi:hypothetical protein